MKRTEFLDKLTEALFMEKGSLQPENVLKDLNWDSMHSLEFQALVDELLDEQVDPAAMGDCTTIGDLCDLAKIEPGE
mgnify:CR=1 FL=1